MIVRLTGGLCNQFFMYAFGRSLSLRRSEPVQFWWTPSTWSYGLDAYNTKIESIKPRSNNQLYFEPTFAFAPEVLEQPSNTYFSGYWQTEKYFKEFESVIRQELALKNPVRYEVEEIAKRLRNENSIFLHVRRGDYLSPGTAAYHGNLGHASLQEGYYKDAIDYTSRVISDPKFVVFSDDPGWCQQHLPYPVISGLTRYEDLYLMSQCRHGIGANSTFSWWANWLGERPGRICIAPQKWFNADADTRDLIPSRWIRL